MVGFCICGAGRRGQFHARTLRENDKATLQYVYDVIPEAAKELAERYGARVAPDVQTALASEDVDAVIITTHAGSHVELVTEAARAGKAIFTEKPLSEDIETAINARSYLSNILPIFFRKKIKLSFKLDPL